MNKIVPIGTAAKALGVPTSILQRWKASGRLVPVCTEDNRRRHDLEAVRPERHHGAQVLCRTIAYAPVSSHNQKADLERQKQVTEIVLRALYCASQSWTSEVIADLDSGMNYQLIDAVRQAVKEAQ